jgi:hypothetical protein
MTSAFLELCRRAGVDPDSIPDAEPRNAPPVRRFKPRKPQRLPDRAASRDRRRMLGSSGHMPPHLRSQFTEGERAVLAIVAGEVKTRGICDLPLDRIAALAGVSRSTTQNAIRAARRLGIIKVTARPRPGRKNLPNLVEIVSLEWSAWIKRGPTAHKPDRVQNDRKLSATKSIEFISCGVAAARRPQGSCREREGVLADAGGCA